MITARFTRLAAGGLALVLAATLAACSGGGSSTSPSATPKAGGDLVMARADDATSLLAQETSSNTDIWLLQQVYEGLTANKTDGSGVQPDLATSWTTSSDGLAWTFKLRQGVKYSDGTAMTADDVVFSLNFARTDSDINQWASLFAPISGVKKVDASTVEIDLSSVWPALPAYLALYAAPIYPANFGGHDLAWLRGNTIGTGPFKVDSWTKGQQIKLVKNPNYWNASSGTPYLNTITFTVVPDDNTRALQLQGKQIGVDEFPSDASMASLSKQSGIVTKALPSTAILYMNLNNRVAGLDDPYLRRALSYAIDRESIIKAVLSGYGTPANSFLSSSLPGWDKSVDGAKYDMALAKSTLAKSSHPTGMPLTIEVAAGNSTYQQIAEIAQQSWSKLGFTVTIKQADPSVVRTDRRSANFNVLIGYATSDVVDPYEMVSFLTLTKSGNINSGYGNDTVTALAKTIQTASAEADRNAALSKLQQQVATDAPIIPIAYEPSLYAWSDTVKGFGAGTLGTYTLPQTWLAK